MALVPSLNPIEPNLGSIRSRFPALSRMESGKPVIYLDGPAGTQVPQSVADRITDVLLHHNANRHGYFATSREGDEILQEAHQAAADWVRCKDPGETFFGANMTSLTFQFSRALSQTWNAGDEVLVTRLDHDANHTPWILAARDRGVFVKTVDIHPEDATLDVDDFAKQLSDKTRLVAFTCASNSVGSRTPIAELTEKAHAVGAKVFLDAVHYAPHDRIDVEAWGCDFLACSVYKFFGPHIGILWGRREELERMEAYKVEPAPNEVPEKWMTGTQNVAALAGVTGAIDYVADLVPTSETNRSRKLDASFAAIRDYEQRLVGRLIHGLVQLPKVRHFGITDPTRMSDRVPTIAINIDGYASAQAAQHLGNQGIYVWHGNYYALQLSRRLGQEPTGMVRLGLMHYNTIEEVDRTIDAISKM